MDESLFTGFRKMDTFFFVFVFCGMVVTRISQGVNIRKANYILYLSNGACWK